MSSIQRTLLMALSIVLIVYGIYRTGFSNGWDERDAEMQAEIARKNEEARATEQKLAAQITANATKLQEANHVISKKQSDLDRAIRAGRVRLPAPSCVQATTDSTPSTGNRNEADDGSDRETLAAIAALVAEGERNTQQLNACIDAYNQVRDQINAGR